MRHVFVVGGTGMLAGMTRSLLLQSDAVSVVARSRRGIQRVQPGSPRLHPVPLNYARPGALRAGVLAAQLEHGPIDLAVCWIHSSAPHAPEEVVGALPEGARCVRIHGSAAAAPEAPPLPPGRPDVTFQDVVLGFVREGNRSRWLTDDEISDGVFAAITSGASHTVVGTVEPWIDRP